MRRFADQRVVIVGVARQGCALARFFCAQGAHVVVTDLRPACQLRQEIDSLAGLPIEYVLGGHPFTLLDGCDLLCLSGGVPPETPLPQEARRRGIPLSNDSLLTLELSPAPLIGVTGSSGKTTTTTLVGEMLNATGLNAWVGGNIGTPLIDRLSEIAAGDSDRMSVVVLELSSFQLQLFDASPQVSAVLNITPNHLDRHPSMAHYVAAKANILRFQSSAPPQFSPVRVGPPQAGRTEGRGDIAVLNVDDAITGQWWRKGRVDIKADIGQSAVHFAINAQKLGFSLAEEVPGGAFLRGDHLMWRQGGQEAEVCTVGELRLLGRHNVANILAACAISGATGATPDAMRHVARTFTGVLHRLELVRELDGVRWYNDSIATTPERVIAALRSFAARTPLVLLAGGRDKHLPWDEMADLTLRRVRHLILFGEAAGRIAGEIEVAQRRAPDQASPPLGGAPSHELRVHRCNTLEEAVRVAARVTGKGDVVLLSPGGTSFDAYRDFEERGEHYRRLVNAL